MNRLLTLALTATAAFLAGRFVLLGSLEDEGDFLTPEEEADVLDAMGDKEGADALRAELGEEWVKAALADPGAVANAQAGLLALADVPYLGMPAVYVDRTGVHRAACVSRIDDEQHRIVTLHAYIPEGDQPVTVIPHVSPQPEGAEFACRWQPA